MNRLLATALFASLIAFAGCKKKDTASSDNGATTAAAKATDNDNAPKPADPAAKPADPAAPAAKPAGGVTNYNDYKSKTLMFAAKMTEVFKADAADCDKLATDVGAITADPDFVAVDAYEGSHADDKKKLDAETKPQQDDMMKALTPVLEKCKDNKKVADVFSKIH